MTNREEMRQKWLLNDMYDLMKQLSERMAKVEKYLGVDAGNKDWVNSRFVANWLGITVGAVSQRLARGEIFGEKRGGRYVFRRDYIESLPRRGCPA